METNAEIPVIPGTPFGGGFYAGRLIVTGAIYAVIVAPNAEGERKGAWLGSEDRVEGADSYCDGLANTDAMVHAGSALAQWARDLRIGGFDDWYLPSQDELEIAYRYLKPTSETNTAYARSGLNASAVGPTYPYTPDSPARTTCADFVAGGAEAFDDAPYWSSTQHAAFADFAWYQYFGYGGQSGNYKSASLRARAVRRFPI